MTIAEKSRISAELPEENPLDDSLKTQTIRRGYPQADRLNSDVTI